jgi:hypothetical protein
MAEIENRVFKNVPSKRIKYRNFQGKAGQYNNEGERYFCLVIDEEDAKDMMAEGWNVKLAQPKREGDEPFYYIQVKVEYTKGRPPKIVQKTKKGSTIIGEDSVQNLDWAEIDFAHISIRPYQWSMPNGAHGVKAYLKTMHVYLEEDEFDDSDDYYDVPESSKDIVDEAPWDDD